MAKAKVSNKAAPQFDGNDLAKIGVDGGWSKPDEAGIVAMLALGLLSTDGQPDEDGDVFYKASEAGLAWLKENGFGDEVQNEQVAGFAAQSRSAESAIVNSEAGKQSDKLAREHGVKMDEPSPFADELDSDVPMPERKRGGPRTRKPREDRYHFNEMEVGQSLHIAVTEKVPNPAKTYSSVVSSHNAKFGTARVDDEGQPVMRERNDKKTGTKKLIPALDYSKHWSIFPVGADDKRGAGARIMRDK